MPARRPRHVAVALTFTALCLPSSLDLASGAEFNIADSDEAGLIAAMNDANANAEADVIHLAENGIYTLTTVEDMTDGSNGLPSVTGEIVIHGNGSIIRRSSGVVPPFRIFHLAATGNLSLHDLVVRNGHAIDGTSTLEQSGGGIFNLGSLTLDHCTIEENRAGNGAGNNFGDPGGDGGGIYNDGLLIVFASTIRANRSGNGGFGLQFGGSGGSGGGIYNAGLLHLTRSILSANQAGNRGGGPMIPGSHGDGGGLYNITGGDANITSSTISENIAMGSGGGLRNHAQLLITSTTITQNTAPVGGGVANNADLDMTHTLIVHQTMGDDCTGFVPLSLGYNFDSDGSCALTAAGDMTVLNALLGTLQDNGGPTLTHAPLAGSPVIDAGDSGASQTDQRGFDGDGDGTGAADIGAVEYYDCDDDGVEDAPGDADADTIPDGCDECPEEDDLLDTDEDGEVDCKDPCPADASDDSDGDGVCDSNDACPDGDDTADADSDGVPDACDETPTGACCGGGLPAVSPLLILGWGRVRRRRRSRAG